MGERNNVRIDYLKLDRFGEVISPTPSAGDFDFDAGPIPYRARLEHVVAQLYVLGHKTDRFEWGLGLGFSIFDFRPKVVSPARQHKEDTEAGIFPSGATFFTWRISRRWASHSPQPAQTDRR
jgi:hypothetical protein